METTLMQRTREELADAGKRVQQATPILQKAGYVLAGIADLTVEAVARLAERKRWERLGEPETWDRLGERSQTIAHRAGDTIVDGVRTLSDRGRLATERSRVVLGRRWPAVEPEYETLTVEELRDYARAADIPGRSSMHKDELIAALRTHTD